MVRVSANRSTRSNICILFFLSSSYLFDLDFCFIKLVSLTLNVGKKNFDVLGQYPDHVF
jgi:hypothetical protein